MTAPYRDDATTREAAKVTGQLLEQSRIHRRRILIVGVGVAIVLALLSSSRFAHAGYTHYWRWKSVPARAELEATLVEMDKVAVARRAILTDAQERKGSAARFRGTCPWGDDGGTDTPCIMFNGIGDDQHETFGFPLAPFTNNPEFSFVKTAYKPYDVVAVACLIVARDHFPKEVLQISSDGTWDGEFTDGARLYTTVLGRAARNPLSKIDLPTTSQDASLGSLVEAAASAEPAEPDVVSEREPTPASARNQWLVSALFVLVVVGVLVVYRRPR